MTTLEFEHLARLVRPQLLGVGRHFFGDETHAEDVAQETLMRLWMAKDRLSPGTDNLEALAMRMARNWCVSEWRREHTAATADSSQSPASNDVPTPTNDEADSRLRTSEALLALQRAVGSLSAGEQRLFRMRHELEMDIGQIAAATGIHPRSISAMLSKTRSKLKGILKKGGIL